MNTVSWNYNKSIVTYKEKEIIEETNVIGGLTHSRRCYSPEELRRAKQTNDSQGTVKKPIIKEKVEQIKKMKDQHNSIIYQLRKTPSISHCYFTHTF